MTNRQAKPAYLENLPAARGFRVKGPKTAPSKFFTISKAWDFWRPDLHTILLGLIELCKDNAWVDHWEDIFTSSSTLRSCVASAKDSVAVEAPVATGGSSASSSSSSAAQQPKKQVSASMAKQEAVRKRQLIVSNSKHVLHACARLVADTDFVHYNDLIAELTRPLGDEHSQCSSGVHDEASVRAYFADMARGDFQKPLRKIIASLRDSVQLVKMGFVRGFTAKHKAATLNDPAVLEQDNFAAVAWNLVAHLLTERCVDMSPHLWSFPESLGGIGSNDAEEVQSALHHFQ